MDLKAEKRRLISSALITIAMISLLWVIKAYEYISDTSLAYLGILPLKTEGLAGIIFAPLIHGGIEHLISNSIPLFLLGIALIYYYQRYAVAILIYSWLITGFWVWVIARGSAYHIGASGIVYALATFHFVSGIIRRESSLIAFSLLVTFLYGSFVWGIFPGFTIEKNISWESHLMGALAGLILAFYFRDKGPQKKEHIWPDEDDDDEFEYEQEDTEENSNSSYTPHYQKPTDESKNL